MGKKTTALFDKTSIRLLEIFCGQVGLRNAGIGITRDQAIEMLTNGYKNPNFNEASFLASFDNKLEVAESVS